MIIPMPCRVTQPRLPPPPPSAGAGPPKPGGPKPQVEVQPAYRDRLKAAGKAVRLVRLEREATQAVKDRIIARREQAATRRRPGNMD